MAQNAALDVNQADPRTLQDHSTSVETQDKTSRLSRQLELLCVVALAAIYFLWFAWPLFWSGSENLRLVAAFNTDEEAHVILIKEAIDSRFPRLGYIQYGYAYLNMGLVPLFLLSYFTEVTEQQIIVWLRIIPSLFAIATVALTFFITRRYFGRLAAWLAAFLLSVTVLNFLEMSAMSHSDIPQVFFIMLSIYFCCRWAEEARLKWLIWASAAAGFAFGCKYSGLFLLPIIGFYGILQTIHLDTTQIKVNSGRVVKISRLLVVLAGVGLLILGFMIIPYAAAPYVDAEYFGVSLTQFFSAMRSMSIVAGIVLILLAVVPFVWAFIRQRPKLAYLAKLGMLSAITFAVSFFVTSPFNAFSVRSGFVRGFLYESLHSSFGHGFQSEGNKLQWFGILFSPELLDIIILGLATVGLVLTAYKVASGGWQKLLEAESVMWIWALYYFFFLFWRVNIRTHRALLPIIPFLIILGASAFSQIMQYVTAKLSRQLAAVVTVASLLIIVGVELPQSLNRMLDFRQQTGQREQTSDAVLAGHWLAEHYPPSTRVLYDPFSYVPPSFTDARITPWGGTIEILETTEPDVVIVNEYSADRFSDIRQASNYARDKAEFMARYRYYQALTKGETDYALERDFGEVQIYTRR
jgi:hypothetical protein